MNCMKCGRETDDNNVFCQNCLLEMEKYPVQPGSVVLLPRRKESSVVRKTPKRHFYSADEQIRLLKKWVLILILLLTAAVTAIAIMFKPSMHYIMDQHFEIGQNYSSVIHTIATAPTAE